MDPSGRRAVGVKPTLKMTAVGAVGAKCVDIRAVDLAGAGYRRMAIRGDDHHLFREHR